MPHFVQISIGYLAFATSKLEKSAENQDQSIIAVALISQHFDLRQNKPVLGQTVSTSHQTTGCKKAKKLFQCISSVASGF